MNDTILVERKTLELALDSLKAVQISLSGDLYAGIRYSNVINAIDELRAVLAAQATLYPATDGGNPHTSSQGD